MIHKLWLIIYDSFYNEYFKCNEALEKGGCGSFRVRPLTESSDQARKKAAMVAREQRYDLDIEPGET